MDFLRFLRDDIRSGLVQMPSEYRTLHAAWIAAQEHSDGGFRNRRGNPELYYTTFAVRSLSALDALSPEIAHRTILFLRQVAKESRTFADAVAAASWWDALALCEEIGQHGQPTARAARGTPTGFMPAEFKTTNGLISAAERDEARAKTCSNLEKLRRDDGGWAKTPIEGNGSLYHTLLAVCAYECMGTGVPRSDELKGFLSSLEQPAGGFLENRYSKRPGTNGTAAGVALSLALKAQSAAGRVAEWAGMAKTLLPTAARELAQHAEFLKGMRNEEGGFQATPSAPIADLLSTYTGLFTLKQLGALEPAIVASAVRYARTLEDEGGGYAGFALETSVDCEYTFYGLGIESIASGR